MRWKQHLCTHGSFRNTVLYLSVAAVWGSGFVAIEVGLAYFPPGLYATLRNGVAAAFMFGYVFFANGRVQPDGREEWLAVIISGILIVGGSQGFLFLGQQGTKSGVAAIITGTIPLLTASFSRVVPPVDYLTSRRLVGLLVGFVGVVLVVQPSLDQFSGGIGGKSLVLLGAGCFAIGSVVTQRLTDSLPVGTQQAWAMAIGALSIALASLSLGESPASVQWTGEALGALFYLIAIPSSLGFLLYFKLLNKYDSTKATSVTSASPIFATLTGWVVLSEGLNPVALCGLVVILVGFGLVPLSR